MAGYRARGRVPEGQAAGAGAVLLREHGPSHHQGRQEREFSSSPRGSYQAQTQNKAGAQGSVVPLGPAR